MESEIQKAIIGISLFVRFSVLFPRHISYQWRGTGNPTDLCICSDLIQHVDETVSVRFCLVLFGGQSHDIFCGLLRKYFALAFCVDYGGSGE